MSAIVKLHTVSAIVAANLLVDICNMEIRRLCLRCEGLWESFEVTTHGGIEMYIIIIIIILCPPAQSLCA